MTCKEKEMIYNEWSEVVGKISRVSFMLAIVMKAMGTPYLARIRSMRKALAVLRGMSSEHVTLNLST